MIGDIVEAVSLIADPFTAIPDDAGLEATKSNQHAIEIDPTGRPITDAEVPDFTALFPTSTCDRDSCEQCAGYQLTPRTASTLWSTCQLRAGLAYEDVIQFGDEPADPNDGRWSTFDEYPSITWRQNAVWRRQAARAFTDLADDLANGDWPQPRCAAEEMALHLAISMSRDAVHDDWPSATRAIEALPAHPDHFDWDMAKDVLFQDHDILNLFDLELDGIEDPDTSIGMGDYRPHAWFKPFNSFPPRDGRRPFRR
ncbi:hypothetical protein [Alloactinosynnema sp. L-07]|uniref:hypothetical protein n=1 Tax=Alloactinosynnema sp. L-07 TaxID=1653480 RepID=UPI00065F0512|nr:hypothetical protein [Alloactinosynnema sp. L-07]CRK57590.1 hypothetical protein [Alloactinosynnema sp. L-07]